MLKTTISLILILWTVGLISAQDEGSQISAFYTQEKMIADGVLDEAIWAQIPPSPDFWQQFPTDSISALGKTNLQIAYDDENVYVAVTCFSKSNDFVITSLKRDFSFRFNDNITLLFDTYGDQTNAFVFGMNAMGVLREALISNGGRNGDDFQSSWDNKWNGDAKIYDNYWIGEFVIPFRILRFQKGANNWRFNCYRSDTQLNEYSSLNRVPVNRIIMDLSYSMPLKWEDPPQGGGSNISVIPYMIARTTRDFEDPLQGSSNKEFNLGGDAKIAVTSGLNLDLTANPDFSQVEVDQQVTNLDRFEIFFPEKRQFFLENADLFGSFGLSRVNPFFSRRIGIAADTATGQNIQNPIIYGARLSGKLNKKLRVGLLNMMTDKQEQNGLPAFNYTVAALQQQVFSRSNISFLFVNKDAVNASDFQGDFNAYNRVVGLEYRLATPDNRWQGKAIYHRAFSPVKEEHPFVQFAQLEYQRKHYRFEWAHAFVGNGFNAEVGFVPRKDYLLLSPEVSFYLYPKKGSINQHSFTLDNRIFYAVGKDDNEILDPWTVSERQHELSWEISFKNYASLSMTTEINDLTLLRDFDPTRLQDDDIFLPAGSDYQYSTFALQYESDQRKTFYYSLSPTFGGFFNGSRTGLGASLTYRYQPYGSVTMNIDYNRINLDSPFEPASIWLIGPKIELTFSKKLFLTTFIQYNNQVDNLNVNARFQWRFAPVSDFFIVYTNNFLTDDFSQFTTRNRALVGKVTYWLNL